MLIELDDVAMVYHVGTHEVRALDGISLKIQKNEYEEVSMANVCGLVLIG